MHLLELPDDIFLDIFKFLDEEWFEDRIKALKSIRLSCKRFLPLVESQFFSNLELKPTYDIPALTVLARSIGLYVHNLILDLFEVTRGDDWATQMARDDILLSTLITHLPNLLDITFLTLCDSRIEFPQLTRAMGTLKTIKHFRIVEIDPVTEKSCSLKVFPLSDGIIQAILNSSGSSLTSLVFDGRSSMSTETFEVLRTKATKLQKLQLREFVNLNCRAALSENVPWACRETLEHLAFLDCRGAHSGAIVCGVGNRLWCTKLRTLEVLKCGDHDDIRDLPYPLIDAIIPTVEKVHYEHAFRWELEELGKLKAKEVMLTYLPRMHAIELVAGGAFPGMEHLKVSKRRVEEVDDSEIKKACEQRRVKLSMDGAGKVNCDCPYGAME